MVRPDNTYRDAHPIKGSTPPHTKHNKYTKQVTYKKTSTNSVNNSVLECHHLNHPLIGRFLVSRSIREPGELSESLWPQRKILYADPHQRLRSLWPDSDGFGHLRIGLRVGLIGLQNGLKISLQRQKSQFSNRPEDQSDGSAGQIVGQTGVQTAGP